MNFKRIISTILAVLMLMGSFAIVSGAEETTTDTEVSTDTSTDGVVEGGSTITNYTENTTPTINYLKGRYDPEDTGVEPTSKVIENPADKLAKMDMRLEKDGYRLYVDAYSGEVATYCIATGETLFTNPWNVGADKAVDNIKAKLLSQIIVHYTDITTGQTYEYVSYTEAAERGQIIVKNIKNGIRVEYTIGRENARRLLPRLMEREAFETEILGVLEAALGVESYEYKLVMYHYPLLDQDEVDGSALEIMKKQYPITDKMDVYALSTSVSKINMTKIEELIKTYCTEFSYEDLDNAHLKTEYADDEADPPLFKMALEYKLDEKGMTVRLPANGIRFNETLYRLESLEILPYMGAGMNPNAGYNFFPDGSGALFDFEMIAAMQDQKEITGKIYGQDYAYHTITGEYQEILRYPVFGIVETEKFVEGTSLDAPAFALPDSTEEGETTTEETTEETTDAEGEEGEEVEIPTFEKDRGFVAIIEEGDALMELTTFHGGRTTNYNTIKMKVYPRPKDTYNVADSISIGEKDSSWTVVSSRKYTGNYKIRYIMLTDDNQAASKGVEDYYECSYLGMALAYRNYLEDTGVLTKLTAEDVNAENIPLYIETFGALQTTERILSVPVDVMTPLTTMADIKSMYDALSEKGVTNINFIMTGYTKGGMTNSTVPYKLDWANTLEKEMTFEELLALSKTEGFDLYPNFDFAFINYDEMFDGVTLSKHAVKTIDGRYSSKREYSATKQTQISYFELAVSPAYFSRFYEKLSEGYSEYDPEGIAVSTLGTYLTSDFDEDEPYNREDAKSFTEDAFKFFDEKYNKVLTSGGNSFTWKYVDHITNVALDSSRYLEAAAAVPFLGIVLHGYVEFAGTPVNMEGNIDYAVLKAIENGAALNFILSYKNTENLKTDVLLSHYYSIRYDIWEKDVVEIYNKINDLLKDVQTSAITEHKFLTDAIRIPDSDELEDDANNAVLEAIKVEKELAEAKIEEDRLKLFNARKNILESTTVMAYATDEDTKGSAINMLNDYLEESEDYRAETKSTLASVISAMARVDQAKADLEQTFKDIEDAEANTAKLEKEYADLDEQRKAKVAALKEKKAAYEASIEADDAANKINEDYEAAEKALNRAQKLYDNLLKNDDAEESAIAEAKAALDTAKATFTDAEAAYNKMFEDFPAIKAAYDAYMKADAESDEAGKAYAEKKAELDAAKKLTENKDKTIANAEKKVTQMERALQNAINDAESGISKVYEAADEALVYIIGLIDSYEKALDDIVMLEELGVYTEEARADFAELIDGVKDIYEEIKPYEQQIRDSVKADYEALVDLIPETEVEEFVLSTEVEEEVEEEEEKEETLLNETNQNYKTDDNKIVYEKYENGKAFVLNFNNYAVIVNVNGTYYDVDAYGYIVLN